MRREGTDGGSLRSFDRELKARSRQFSDATSIVTIGGRWSASLFLSFSLSSLSFSLFRSFRGVSGLSLSLSLPSLSASIFLRARPSACLPLPPRPALPASFRSSLPPTPLPPPERCSRAPLSAPYFPVFCGRFVNLSAAFIGARRCKRKSLPITYYCVSILQRAARKEGREGGRKRERRSRINPLRRLTGTGRVRAFFPCPPPFRCAPVRRLNRFGPSPLVSFIRGGILGPFPRHPWSIAVD